MIKNPKSTIKNDQGVALIIAVLFLVVMAILATASALRVSNHTSHVNSYQEFQETYLGLTSAYEQGLVGGVMIGVPDDTDLAPTVLAGGDVIGELNAAMDAFQAANPGLTQLSNAPNVQYAVVNVGVTNAGAGFDESSTYATARYLNSGGTSIQRTILGVQREATGNLPNINVWTNAIFAGVQQSGNTINGNVSVHGSVHILGEDAVLGDTSVVLPDVIELGGGAGIYNNYDGMPADLRSRVPDPPLDENGNEHLDTKFRVKNGMVNINGNTKIGTSSSSAGTKPYLDGVYVNNQWMGNKTSNGEPVNGVVYSDNGYNQGYDLGNAISFPHFDEEVGEVYEESPGQIYFDSSDSSSYYYTGQTPYTGNITLVPGTASSSFYYNSSTGAAAVVGQSPGSNGMPTKAEVQAMAAAGEFVIWYNGADTSTTGDLYVNGRVAVDGNISFNSGTGQKKTINYTGQGSVMAFDGGSGGGSVNINANLLTTSFPLTNVIGIMAENNFNLGTSSQISMMGGFYAQGGITINKQTNIVGSIVADYFDMGGQVPNIYYVPELGNSWTAESRMIGMGIVTAPGGLGEGAIWFEVGVPL